MTSGERGTMVSQNMKKTIFGFAFVDAAAGCFYVGSLEDDSARSALCSLLTQVYFYACMLHFRKLGKFMYQIGRLTENKYSTHKFFVPFLGKLPRDDKIQMLHTAEILRCIIASGQKTDLVP
mgnify:FL=1